MILVEMVDDLCSTYEFMVNCNQHVTPYGTTRESFLSKIETYAKDKTLHFDQRIKCCEYLDTTTIGETILEEMIGFNLSDTVNNEIKYEVWFNFFMARMSEEYTNIGKRLYEELVSKNTIARGYNIYNSVQMLHRPTRKYIAGLSRVHDISKHTPSKPLLKDGLDSYFFQNQLNVTNFLIPVLQMYTLNNWITPEMCRISQGLVVGDEKLTNDLADFFLYTLPQTEQFREFNRWGENNIRLLRVVGELNHNSQSVHQLDSCKTKFLLWMIKSSTDFERSDQKMRNYTDMKNKISSAIQTGSYFDEHQKVVKINKNAVELSVQRFSTDNVKIMTETVGEYVLKDVFDRVVFIISNHKEYNLLWMRLIEELTEMSGTCFSGHYNRLFNVFTGIEDGLVYIDMKHEFTISLKTSLQNVVDETSEEMQEKIMNGLSGDPWEEDTKTYVVEEVKKWSQKFSKQYVPIHMTVDEFNTTFSTIVNKYFGFDVV
ncbi:MAG: hypothetical protein PHG66_00990 [Candidatus Colwellbacteria bacterium]|nr:hypothetical protein [Candidatus Colwellbacteria bacterium]